MGYTAEEIKEMLAGKRTGTRGKTWDIAALKALMGKDAVGVISAEDLAKICPNSSNLKKGKVGFFVLEAANKLNEYFAAQGKGLAATLTDKAKGFKGVIFDKNAVAKVKK